jgi:hypothetical protein
MLFKVYLIEYLFYSFLNNAAENKPDKMNVSIGIS